ncbi:MAG: hypothetical protein KDB00_23635, partial [Planctomycetales bacterium]|nr:hypothetical protein [Planctomycetales bacterium]
VNNNVVRLTYEAGDGNEIELHYTGSGISIADVTDLEGNEAGTIFQIPVTLDFVSAGAVTDDYTTDAGAAFPGLHYESVSGTLTFAPGETTQIIDVPILSDQDVDPTVDFYIQLSNPTNASLIDDIGQVIIFNDDHSGIPDSLGTEFWVSIPENWVSYDYAAYIEETGAYDPTTSDTPTDYSSGFFLSISSEFGATGVITAPGIAESIEYSVEPGEVTTVRLWDELEPYGYDYRSWEQGPEAVSPYHGLTDQVLPVGVHVTADSEVSVYAMAIQPFTSDGFLVLPTDVLGTNYMLASHDFFRMGRWEYAGNPVGHSAGSQFQVIGIVDNTQVQITPTSSFTRVDYPVVESGDPDYVPEVVQAGQTYTITLNRGDVYSLRADHAGVDFTGTIIDANAPVAVNSGMTCANVPVEFPACDTLVEQMTPTNTWGKEFVVNPLEGRNVDRLRIIALEDETQIQIGSQTIQLDAGQFEVFDLANATRVTSDKPISVVQYSTGSDYTGEFENLRKTIGDPMMILIPPVEQFLEHYVVTSAVHRNDDNYLSLIVPTAAINDLTINGQYVDPGVFEVVDGSDFSAGELYVEDGFYSADAPLPFGITVYGFADYESYGYLGGQTFIPLDANADIQLDPAAEMLVVGDTHYVTATVIDLDTNLPLAGVRVDFEVTGTHPNHFWGRTNSSGEVIVHWSGNLAGTDQIQATALGDTANASADWFGAFPTIEIVSPQFGSEFEHGSTVLITGKVESGSPEARIVSLTMDNDRIATVDALGNFFVTVELPLGTSTFDFEVFNSYGASATTTLSLEGIFESDRDPNEDSLNELASITELYAVTSFDERTDILYADLSIKNTSELPISKPFLLGVRNITDPTVQLLNIAGYWEDGTPYIDLSAQIYNSTLAPGSRTFFNPIEFYAPQRNPFEYEFVLLGGENEPPRFTSIPIINARGGEDYAASVTAVDPDDDSLTFFFVSGPTGMIVENNYDGTASLVWDNVPSAAASFPVKILVRDSRDAETTQSFVVSVVDPSINHAPLIFSQPVTDANAETDYSYTVVANDFDGDPVSYAVSIIRSGDLSATELAGIDGSGKPIVYDPVTGEIAWTPQGADVAQYDVVIDADDGRGGTDTQRYVLYVHPVPGNHPPLFTSAPPETISSDSPFEYYATAIDPDLDDLVFTMPVFPSGALISLDG